MSFRQDRTNPSTAISNWEGRTETPKGHPSTRVSQWLNGGLFGGGSVDTWFTIYSFDSSYTASYGAGFPGLAMPWENATNTPLDADGNVFLNAVGYASSYIFYRMTPSGVIVDNAGQVGAESITNGNWQRYTSGSMTTDGSDLLLQGGSAKYSPDSGFRIMPGLCVSPLSVTNTSGTPTVEDFECYNINGSSWSTDRFRTILVYNDDRASSNTLYWVMGGKPTAYTGWVFGTYNTSTDTITCTGAARATNSDWAGEETNCVSQGSSGRMYGFAAGVNGKAGVFMSDATSQGSSNAFQKMRNQSWQKTFTYTSAGHCFGAYQVGTYSGQDQYIGMFMAQQVYGAFETYIVKFTPYNGQVQDNTLIYASSGQGSMYPDSNGSRCMCIDSSGNLYITMTRDGFSSIKETVVMMLDSDLTVQWTRVMQMTTSNTWGTSTSGQVQIYTTGINLTADEQHLMVHGFTEYYPGAGQWRKGFSFKVKADGTGAMANSGDAHKIGSGGLTPTISNSYPQNYYVRYYDPADTSASPTPRPVNVTSLSGNWGSATANGNSSSNYYGTQSAANKPTMSSLANINTYYGNYVYENTFD